MRGVWIFKGGLHVLFEGSLHCLLQLLAEALRFGLQLRFSSQSLLTCEAAATTAVLIFNAVMRLLKAETQRKRFHRGIFKQIGYGYVDTELLPYAILDL